MHPWNDNQTGETKKRPAALTSPNRRIYFSVGVAADTMRSEVDIGVELLWTGRRLQTSCCSPPIPLSLAHWDSRETRLALGLWKRVWHKVRALSSKAPPRIAPARSGRKNLSLWVYTNPPFIPTPLVFSTPSSRFPYCISKLFSSVQGHHEKKGWGLDLCHCKSNSPKPIVAFDGDV